MSAAPARPPGPPPVGRHPVRLLRFFWDFSRNPLGFIEERFEKYGDFYFTVSNGDPLYVLRDPELIHQVLVDKASSFVKRDDLEDFLGQGLLNSNGDLWRRQRRLIQPAFRRERLEAYAEVFVRHALERIATWAPGATIDLRTEMTELTLGIVCETLFAHDVSGEVAEIARDLDLAQEVFGSPLPGWLPTPSRLRFSSRRERLDARLLEMIRQKRDQPEPGTDLLSQLVFAQDEDGAMSEQLLRDEVITLFVAGHETTSLALTWALHLVSQHPEVSERLRAEVDDVVGRAPPQLSHLESLPLVRNVLSEAMRLYPPASAAVRKVETPVEIGGYALEAGAELILWIFHMHRSEKWFVDPLRFDPDRFEPDSGRVLHPSAYIPFGAGQRTCIGRHFARMEAELLLAAIVQRVELERLGNEAVKPKMRITLAPDREIRMRVKNR